MLESLFLEFITKICRVLTMIARALSKRSGVHMGIVVMGIMCFNFKNQLKTLWLGLNGRVIKNLGDEKKN